MSINNFIDLETIPDQSDDAFANFLDQVRPPSNYKKQETIDKWLTENAEAEAEKNYLKTGLDGLYGEICSIGFAIENREPVVLTRGDSVSQNEEELLRQFWTVLQLEIDSHLTAENAHDDAKRWPKLQWIGHNVIDFDLRFLKQRSIVNGIKPTHVIPADARHASGQVFDTMKEWTGWRGYVKQDELVKALGIEIPSWGEKFNDTDGSQVWELFRKGHYTDIAGYNMLDVWKVREIYKRMREFS